MIIHARNSVSTKWKLLWKEIKLNSALVIQVISVCLEKIKLKQHKLLPSMELARRPLRIL